MGAQEPGDAVPVAAGGAVLVTIDLTFSAPMDQSANPVVTFGSGGSYNTYRVSDNTQWVDATHWRATFDVTSFVPRGAYTLSVSSAQGADGMDIPPDTRFGFTADYAGQITDQTPPLLPWVFADSAVGNPSFVTAHWIASDPNSPIIHYRYAIGSAPGAVDVVKWTTIDATTVSRSGLGFVAGQHYWVSVQAQNQGGLWSPVGACRFTAGAKNPTTFLPLVRR